MTDLGGGYIKKGAEIYYRNEKVPDVGCYSFESLGGGYGKDSIYIYFKTEKVNGAYRSSFVSLGAGYAKDSSSVFYYGKKIDAYPSSFEYIGEGYAKDSCNKYYKGEKTYSTYSPKPKVENDYYYTPPQPQFEKCNRCNGTGRLCSVYSYPNDCERFCEACHGKGGWNHCLFGP